VNRNIHVETVGGPVRETLAADRTTWQLVPVRTAITYGNEDQRGTFVHSGWAWRNRDFPSDYVIEAERIGRLLGDANAAHRTIKGAKHIDFYHSPVVREFTYHLGDILESQRRTLDRHSAAQ
jgi:hypothetical protein